ncbi:hypothetical protein ACFU8T_12270 [Sphingobacterium spiritivorum]|uniref:hypothetical protein n=1 Tax=Sphingobacterium spiritivorum TaxID=258 RepID=UPI0036ABFD9B
MVAIFKTNVKHPAAAMNVITELLCRYPAFRISFDLEDEDKILRVEGHFFHVEDIIFSLLNNGFMCIHLPHDIY